LLAADRLNCQPWQLVPSDDPLAYPGAWLQFALTVRVAENKARQANAKKDSGELLELAKKGHRGRVK
jgi:hypothetical protein